MGDNIYKSIIVKVLFYGFQKLQNLNIGNEIVLDMMIFQG